MKKLVLSVVMTTVAIASSAAMACPKGTSLQGGVGSNHKGGKCVPVTGTKQKAEKKQTPKAQAKKAEKKVESKTAPAPQKP